MKKKAVTIGVIVGEKLTAEGRRMNWNGLFVFADLTVARRFWYNSRVLSRESVARVRESIAEDTKKGKNGSDKDQGGAAH